MNLLLVGCGNIGKSLLELWTPLNDLFNKIIVVQPSMSHASTYKNKKNIMFVDNVNSVPKNFKFNFIVLAIKPQTAKELIVGGGLLPQINRDSIIISTLAGIQITQLSK
jgi:pyrroline-5-carboxylate reductase